MCSELCCNPVLSVACPFHKLRGSGVWAAAGSLGEYTLTPALFVWFSTRPEFTYGLVYCPGITSCVITKMCQKGMFNNNDGLSFMAYYTILLGI